jgi:hypothetical protein
MSYYYIHVVRHVRDLFSKNVSFTCWLLKTMLNIHQFSPRSTADSNRPTIRPTMPVGVGAYFFPLSCGALSIFSNKSFGYSLKIIEIVTNVSTSLYFKALVIVMLDGGRPYTLLLPLNLSQPPSHSRSACQPRLPRHGSKRI